MRPVRLEVSGFGAFREAVEIDFADLDLVALVGPTGSGKSTIIDAITFALYGSVPRYDDKGAVAPAISALATEARVLLDFTIGEEAYRVARVVRRTKTGATTKEARLEHGEEVLAGSARELPEAVGSLLGLSFEQFTKTVVLPQGDFAEFLHETPAERQKLLRRLFGLDHYAAMANAARRRADAAGTRAEVLAEELAAEPAVTEAELAALHARADRLEGLRTEVKGELDRLAELDERWRAQRSAAADAAARRDLAATVERPDGIEQRSELVDRTEADRREADEALARARDERRRADEALEAGPDLSRSRDVLERHRRLADERIALDASRDRLAGARDELRSRRDAATEALAVVAAAERAAEAAAVERRHADEACAVGPDEAHVRALLALAAQRDETAEALGRVRAELDEAHRAAASAAGVAATAAEARTAAAAELDSRRAAAGAGALVAQLAVGEPCPVCRQVVGALPDHDPGAELVAAERAHAEAVGRADVAEQRRRDADHDVERAARRLDELTTRLADLDDQLAAAPAVDVLAADLERAAVLRDAADAARLAQAEAEASLADVRRDPRRAAAVASADEADRAVTAAEEAVRHGEARVADLEAGLAGAPGEQDAAADLRVAEELAAAAREARRLEAEAEATQQRATAAAVAAVSAGERDEAALVDARDRLAALGPPALGDGTVARRWDALVAWAAERAAALAEEATALAADAAALETARDELTASVRHRVAEATGAAPAGEPLEELAVAASEVSTRLAAAEAAQQRQAERRRRIAADQEQATVARHLGSLLGARGFEGWLLEEAVHDLVERATERLLELSGGQYSVVAGDGNALRICDHRNADEVRDAKTLSGGETFLASLALALALADSVGELAGVGGPRLESIFLDEGFGTLDPDALGTVSDAIEELAASGRLVGVVTHVRELAERVPVRFEVRKGPTTSTVSRVEA